MTTNNSVELPGEVEVVNLGLALFADAIRVQGRPVVHVDWRIPAGGEPELVAALARLYGRHAASIDAANAEVARRLDVGAPRLVGIEAAAALPGVDDRTIIHCGPAIAWEDMCDPLRRSVRAAVMAEGWADDPAGVDRLMAGEGVRLEPANHHGAVVPMASAIGPTAPMFVVEDEAGGTRAFSSINQGPGEVAWFGRETPAAVERLIFLREVVGPLLGECLRGAGPLDVFTLAAQGLQMGDDMHMRTQATTNLFVRSLLPHLMGLDASAPRVELGRFLSADHLFFLNLAMAGAKALTLWAEQVEGSSMVTTMARNGTTYGIRLAGSDRWFITDSPPIGQALYYPGCGPESSAPDIGDSAVLELIGLGGSAAAASPAVAAFVGGTMRDAIAATEDMDRVCVARSTRFKLPVLDFRGSPVGVDVRKVVELGITPKVNTGILHMSDGSGQVGAGVAEAPLACFREALLDLDRRLGLRV